MNTRKKTLSLQRAYFNPGSNVNLEESMKFSFQKFPNARDRKEDIDLFSSLLFASRENAQGDHGVFVRLLEFEPGAIGEIDLDTENSSAAVNEFFHPKNRNFLKDEIVVLIVGNHIISCNLKNKSGTLSKCMLSLAQKAEVLSEEMKLSIAEVPDRTTLERIEQVGVREVDFNITTYLQNLIFLDNDSEPNRVLQMLFGQPSDNETVRKRANALGRIVLKRGHFEAKEVKKDEFLTAIGKELMEESSSEDFKLRLEDNSWVSASALRRSKSVALKRYANSFSFEHAKQALYAYYIELRSNGSLGD